MKTTALLVMLLIFSVMVAGCKDNIAATGDNYRLKSNDIYGTWVQAGYEEDYIILNRAGNLKKDNYGFIIYRSGKFVERKINGWCGTPPVVYDNYDGAWLPENEKFLKINVGYWGGTTNYKLEILSLTNDELRVRYLHESQ